MLKQLLQARIWRRAGLCLALATVTLCIPSAVWGQQNSPLVENQPHKVKGHVLPVHPTDKPSLPPAFTVPVAPLGFTAPGALYLGQRNSFASLDFLDESRLLFTFRVPGLIRRENPDSDESDERQIRALVLELPSGTIEAEALWSVHDRVRYLWMLKDGHFLLRDRDGLEQGDASLELKPFLHFPGPLLWLELDPGQQFLVTDSREPAASSRKPGEVAGPPTAAAAMSVDNQDPAAAQDTVVRILRRDSGQVMLFSHARSTVHLPINADGYLESLRASGAEFLLNLNYFRGGSAVVGKLDSTCYPVIDFVSQREVLAATCPASGGRKLVAMGVDGKRLWEDSPSGVPVWPLVVMAPDGSRLAWETLAVNYPISASSPLDPENIKGQLVEVLDAANGQVALKTMASPVLDAGGNVAISPSGRRVAVLSEGAIQVFELPAPAAPPAQAGNTPGR